MSKANKTLMIYVSWIYKRKKILITASDPRDLIPTILYLPALLGPEVEHHYQLFCRSGYR